MKKNKKYLLDTNIILRYLLKDNIEQFQQLEAILEDIRLGKIKALITEGVLAECVYVLEKFYKVPKKELAVLLAEILYYKGIINTTKTVYLKALDLYQTRNLDIVDCILISMSEYNGCDLLSFDVKLMKSRKK